MTVTARDFLENTARMLKSASDAVALAERNGDAIAIERTQAAYRRMVARNVIANNGRPLPLPSLVNASKELPGVAASAEAPARLPTLVAAGAAGLAGGGE